MEIEDFEQIYNNISSNGKTGKLALLDAPTGSGKSYAVRQFLCSKALKDENFRSFFITDQKKNLKYEEFVENWNKFVEKSKDKPYQNHKIAYIRSLIDTIELIVRLDANEIPEPLYTADVKQAIKDMGDSLSTYKQMYKIDPTSSSGWNNLKRTEYNFRKKLTEALIGHIKIDISNKGYQDKIVNYISINNNEVTRWMSFIYPTINLEHYQILLCTTDKFFRSYTPFFQEKAIQFQYSGLIQDSFVVIDEFDRTKLRMWEKIIDDALKIRSDLIELFRTAKQSFELVDGTVVPTKLTKIVETDKGYKSLKKISQELDEKFKLQNFYKLDEKVEQNQFENYVIHTVLNTIISDRKDWHSHFDSKEKNVKIDHNKEDDLGFTQMLNRVSGFLRKFNHMVTRNSSKYRAMVNQRRSSVATSMDQMSACFSVYDALGFQRRQAEMLLNVETEIGTAYGVQKNSKKKPDSFHEFQENGLALYSFNDSDEHAFKTRLNAAFLDSTPENFILNITGKCLVLGLSATASIPTVLDNYDLMYLQEKLGDDLINAKALLTEKTEADFDLKSRYKQYGINVEVKVAESQSSLKSVLEQLPDKVQTQIDWNKISDLDSKIEQKLNEIPNVDPKKSEENIRYFRNRYISLFESFIQFILREDIISFLGLSSKLPDDNSKLSLDLISTVFDGLCEQLINSNQVYPKLFVIPDKNSNQSIDDQINSAHSNIQSGTRIYLLSAYLSMGVGQNLQHKISINEKMSAINIATDHFGQKDARNNEIDLGGMYLGPVTNLLSNISSFGLNHDVLLRIIQFETLMDANEISYDKLSKELHNIEIGKQPLPYPKNIISLRLSYTLTIIQALGRMNRTFNKIQHPLIVADSDVINSITSLEIKPENISPELQALFNESEDPSDKGLVLDRLKNQRINLAVYTDRDIHQILYTLRESPDVVSEYKQIRETFLKHPTISKESLVEAQSNLKRCMQYLHNPNKKIVYSDKPIHNLGNSKGEIIVSLEASGLGTMMKYPKMREYFKSKMYATSWKPNDYILNQVQFVNEYVGYLGEVCGRFIVEDSNLFSLEEIEQTENLELFDFKIKGRNIVVDFKNWSPNHLEDNFDPRTKTEKKLKQFNENAGEEYKVIILNVIKGSSNPVSIKQTVDNKIMEISALIDLNGKLVLNKEHIKRIGEFLIE